MFKQYFIQTLAQLRQHRLISLITIIATALSIFLIMLVVMMEQVKVAPFSPESNRNRFLHVRNVSIGNNEWGDGTSNGPMSLIAAKRLYKSIESAEAVTAYCAATLPMPVSLPGQPLNVADVRETDEVYWRVFDFRFIEGRAYDEAAVESHLPQVVITQSMARTIFGTDKDLVGREFQVNFTTCKVVGVVKDVSTLATNAYGQIWIPYGTVTFNITENRDELMGWVSVTILAKDRADFPVIRKEAKRRMDEYNRVFEEMSYYYIDRNRPYTQEKDAVGKMANIEPDLPAARRRKWTTFLILLIVPAVNLSSMTQSRLKQRISEIGVRRAFGCTRSELVWQIIMENMIITLIAGLIGLLMSLCACWFFAADFFAQPMSNTLNEATVDASILIHYSTFGYALVFCFVLNLLSSGIPALRASRIRIVNALTGKR